MSGENSVRVPIGNDDLSRAVGELILSDEDYGGHAYLAGLSLETMGDDDYEIEDTLMEFIENAHELDLTEEEVGRIESMVRE